MPENHPDGFDRAVSRRRLEEEDLADAELVIVHDDNDPDDRYHDHTELNKLNAALGTLTTVEWAEGHGYERCSECYG